MESKLTFYLLNEEKRILLVGGDWDDFALKNEGDNIIAKNVENKLLWNFIKGDSTKMWVDTLIQFALTKDDIIERPYRCDSHDYKRFMQMRILPESYKEIKVEHHLIKKEKKSAPTHIKFAGDKWVNIHKLRCSICGRIKYPTKWDEPKANENNKNIYVIYTVCENCREK